MPIAQTLTVGQLLEKYREKHIAGAATIQHQRYQIATVTRTILTRPDPTDATQDFVRIRLWHIVQLGTAGG
jgi:hypothetical protein